MKKAIITAVCLVLVGCQQPASKDKMNKKIEQNTNAQKNVQKKEQTTTVPRPVNQMNMNTNSNMNMNKNKPNTNMLMPSK